MIYQTLIAWVIVNTDIGGLNICWKIIGLNTQLRPLKHTDHTDGRLMEVGAVVSQQDVCF